MRSRPGAAPVSSLNSPSCGVSTVGAARRRSSASGAVGVPREREQAVAVDHHRQWRVDASKWRALAAVSSSRPRPGPITTAWNRSSEPQRLVGPPRGRQRALHDLDRQRRPSSTPGTETCTIPAPARCAACAASAAAPGHRRAAGDDPHRRLPLVRDRVRDAATTAATSRRCTRCAPGPPPPDRRSPGRDRCRPARARRRDGSRAGTAAPASTRRT